MTLKMNERDSPVSRVSKQKSVTVLKPVATWILVVFLIVMLLAPFVG